MLGPWAIAGIGSTAFVAMLLLGGWLWLPSSEDPAARFHLGIGFASGGVVALAVFILSLADACSTSAFEEQRQIELLVSQRGGDLIGIDLHDARLDRQYLQGRTMNEAKLSGASLDHATLNGAFLIDADLSSANLHSSNLEHARLTRANLAGADLRSADLNSAYLSHAGLASARLDGAHLVGAQLDSADLSGKKVSLDGADLTEATFTDASLRDASLVHATLEFAHMKGADLSGADLRHADLAGADLEGVVYDKRTRWPQTNDFADPPGAPLSWPPPAKDCPPKPCSISAQYNPLAEFRAEFGTTTWRTVQFRMKELRKLLNENKPLGWELRYGDNLAIELDSIGKEAPATGSEPQAPVAALRAVRVLGIRPPPGKWLAHDASEEPQPPIATLRANPVIGAHIDPQTLTSQMRAMANNRGRRYERRFGRRYRQVKFAQVSLSPAWIDFRKNRCAYMRRYTYVESRGGQVGVDVYYADYALAYVFQASVQRVAYIRYRPDLAQLFHVLGVGQGLNPVVYGVHPRKPFKCSEGSNR
ncbi:MAG TPA: pentapeptide repeat-containing protein [Gaiellaceae bacterium]